MPTYAEDITVYPNNTYFTKWVDPLSKSTGTTREPQSGETRNAAEWALLHENHNGGRYNADYEEYTWYPVRA